MLTIMPFKDNMYAKQPLSWLFFFFKKRSIKWWYQLTHYHRTAVILQVRQCGRELFTFCIHFAISQTSLTIMSLNCKLQNPHCNDNDAFEIS